MVTRKQRDQRRELQIDAIIVDMAGGVIGPCKMANVSVGGAKLILLGSVEPPNKFDILLTADGTVRRHCEIVWRSERDIGVRFVPSGPVKDRPSEGWTTDLRRLS